MKKIDNQNFSILIVDDISKNIQVLGNMLRNESYKTGFATSGKQALKSLKENEFDLILLDIMMPEMDGYEVCRRIRKHKKTKNIPIIFLTAKVEKDSIVKGFEVGAQDYLTKPFNAEELFARVSTHLELHDKRKQLAEMNQSLEKKVSERTKQLQKAFNDLEEANNKLGLLEKAKSDFLGIVSHELRTPLNGIMGFADVLKHSIDDKEQLEYLDYMLESANRLLRFSNIALIIAQLSIDRYKLTFEDRNLKDIIETSTKKLEKKLKEKNLTITFDCSNENILYHCDVELIAIAFSNILENAIQHSPQNEKISIDVSSMNGKIYLTITDNGKGFSDEAMESVFQLFSVGEIMHHKEGFGLGLSATKLILETHGGEVKAENLKEGGAKVTLIMNDKQDKV